jgi:hypothetical protein
MTAPFLRVLSFAAGVVTALSVCGCNMVTSRSPVFSLKDTTGAPALKPGVWGIEKCFGVGRDKACREVPEVIVTPTELRQAMPRTLPPGMKPVDARADYLIVSGAPPIMQVELHASIPAGAIPFLGASSADELYYLALSPTASDADGRITGADVWPVECGPHPKEGDANYGLMDEQGAVTNHPAAGLKMVGAFLCVPRTVADLRRAAVASRSYSDDLNQDIQTLHWVSD